MPLKRLVLVSFILSSFLEANEEIRKSFFEESKSLSQCTFYYPILSEQEKIDIQSEKISISKELTKIFENTKRGKIKDFLDSYENKKLKGEFVIVVKGLK